MALGSFNLCEMVIISMKSGQTTMKVVITTCMECHYHFKLYSYDLEEGVKSTPVNW